VSQLPIPPSRPSSSPAHSVALADQIGAAARETEQADVASWLLPEGVASRVSVDLLRATVLGPVTQALVAWLGQAPHPAGCRVAAASPRPLFAWVEEPAVYCAACFDAVLRRTHDAQSGWCSICRYDSDDLAPTTMRLGVFTVVAFVCQACANAERKATVVNRYRAIARRT